MVSKTDGHYWLSSGGFTVEAIETSKSDFQWWPFVYWFLKDRIPLEPVALLLKEYNLIIVMEISHSGLITSRGSLYDSSSSDRLDRRF